MKVPTGDFGNLVAGPGPRPGVVPGAFGEDVAAAARRLGQTGMQVASNLMAEQERQQEIERRKAEAQREAADRANALSQLAATEDELADAHDEISIGVQNGTVPKDKAEDEWRKRAEKIAKARLPQIPEAHRQIAESQVARVANRLGNGVRKAITERDRRDVGAGLAAYGESMERYAQTDRKGAIQAYTNAIDALGPHAGLNPEEIQKRKQAFREGVTFNNAASLVEGARDHVGELKNLRKILNSDEYGDLDPARRTVLNSRLDQRIEVLQGRQQREAEAHLKRQEAAFTGAAQLLESGKPLSATYVDTVTRALKGSPFAAAFAELVTAGPERVAFATQPLPAQQAMLTQLRARQQQQGTDPVEAKRIDHMERTAQQVAQAVEKNPWQAALEYGAIKDIPPLQLTDVASLGAQITERLDAGRQVSAWTGKPTSPLQPHESEAVAGLLRSMPVDQRAGALEALTAQVKDPAALQAMARDIAGKDRDTAAALLLASQRQRTTSGTPQVTWYLRGAEAITKKTVAIDEKKETGVRAEIAREVEGVYATTDATNAAIDAAYKVYAGLRASGENPDVEQAVRIATGGIIDFNGQRVPKPYGWSDRRFRDAVRKIDGPALRQFAGSDRVYVAGKEIGVDELATQLSSLRLRSAGDNRYLLTAGGAPVLGLTAAGAAPVFVSLID